MADAITTPVVSSTAVSSSAVAAGTSTPAVETLASTEAKTDGAAGTTPEAKTETPNEARLRKLAISAQKDRAAAIKIKEEAEAHKVRAAKLDEFKTTKNPAKWLKENLDIDEGELLSRLSAEALATNGGEAAPTADERLDRIDAERAASIVAQEQAVRAAVKDQLSSTAQVEKGSAETFADRYELINAYGKHDAVFEAVDEYCKAHPGMTAEEVNAAYLEAADNQEAALEAEFIEPASKTKKLAKRFAGRPATETPNKSESAKAGDEAPKQSGKETPTKTTTTLTGLGRSTPTNNQLPKNLSKNSAKRIREIAAWQREHGITQ